MRQVKNDRPGDEIDSRRRRTRRVAMAAVLVGSFAGIGLGVLSLVGSGGDDKAEVGPDDGPEQSSSNSAGGTEQSSSGPVGGYVAKPIEFDPIECPPAIDTTLCELVAFVEMDRERPFKEFPTIDLQADGDFDANLIAVFERESDELGELGQVYQSLGLLTLDDDLAALTRSSVELGVLGFYDPETKNLVVRGHELGWYVKAVLVHELAHAHDDQWSDFSTLGFDDAKDESAYGLLSVQEGNASRVQGHWKLSLEPEERSRVEAEEALVLTSEKLQQYLALPSVLISTQTIPYVAGLKLVEEIAESGGEEAVSRALLVPPKTTEQVLHPMLYINGLGDVSLPAVPESDGETIWQGVWGEVGFALLLSEGAAAGWNGDRYVTWVDGNSVCTRIEVYTDSDEDLMELLSEAKEWANRSADRTVIDGGGFARLTGCAG